MPERSVLSGQPSHNKPDKCNQAHAKIDIKCLKWSLRAVIRAGCLLLAQRQRNEIIGDGTFPRARAGVDRRRKTEAAGREGRTNRAGRGEGTVAERRGFIVVQAGSIAEVAEKRELVGRFHEKPH